MTEQKIERFAHIVATVDMTGEFPVDTTYKEFSEVALWDAIGRRAAVLEYEMQKAAGVTGVIDSSQALKPRENNE